MAVGFLSPSPIPQGLTLVTKQDFTTASTIDILGCFSSTYTNYVMTLNLTAASATQYANFQFLSGSTPASGGYYWGYRGLSSGNSAFDAAGANVGSAYFVDYNSADIGCTLAQTTFFQPFKTAQSSWSVNIVWNNGSAIIGRSGGGAHTTSASYTGLRITTNAGTITGTFRIYGMQDA